MRCMSINCATQVCDFSRPDFFCQFRHGLLPSPLDAPLRHCSSHRVWLPTPQFQAVRAWWHRGILMLYATHVFTRCTRSKALSCCVHGDAMQSLKFSALCA